jgi:hypothetical protein
LDDLPGGDGRALRILVLIDEYTRECLALRRLGAIRMSVRHPRQTR